PTIHAWLLWLRVGCLRCCVGCLGYYVGCSGYCVGCLGYCVGCLGYSIGCLGYCVECLVARWVPCCLLGALLLRWVPWVILTDASCSTHEYKYAASLPFPLHVLPQLFHLIINHPPLSLHLRPSTFDHPSSTIHLRLPDHPSSPTHHQPSITSRSVPSFHFQLIYPSLLRYLLSKAFPLQLSSRTPPPFELPPRTPP
ncbi:hypothetical protein GGR56DRAFT_628291, partial [Xylariaceae sp. FL0804]